MKTDSIIGFYRDFFWQKNQFPQSLPGTGTGRLLPAFAVFGYICHPIRPVPGHVTISPDKTGKTHFFEFLHGCCLIHNV
jgi:hypothetical protein